MTTRKYSTNRQYIPLRINLIEYERALVFDIYRLDDNVYRLIALKGEILSIGALQGLKESGSEVLYIDREHSQRLSDYLSERLDTLLSDTRMLAGAKATILNKVGSDSISSSIINALEEPDFGAVSVQSENHIAFAKLNDDAAKSLIENKFESTPTVTHSMRVANLALLAGINLEIYDFERLTEIVVGSMLHEVGKLRISVTHYDSSETADIVSDTRFKRYPEAGAAILIVGRRTPAGAWRGVQDHQERMDGSGFPEGLGGTEISIAGRLIGACDYYDSQVSPVGPSVQRNPYDVLLEMRNSLDKFDFKVVDSLIRVLANFSKECEYHNFTKNDKPLK